MVFIFVEVWGNEESMVTMSFHVSNGLGFSKVQIRANLWVSKVRPHGNLRGCEDFIDHLRFFYDTLWCLISYLLVETIRLCLSKSFACDVRTHRYFMIFWFQWGRSSCATTEVFAVKPAPKCNPLQAILKRRQPAFHWKVFVVCWPFFLASHVRSILLV